MPKRDGSPTAQEKRELAARDQKLAELETYTFWQACTANPDVLKARIYAVHKKLYSVHPDLWETDIQCLQWWAQYRGLRDAAVYRGMAQWVER